MKIYLFLSIVLLAGCNSINQPNGAISSDSYQYSNTKFGYDITIPKTATGKNTPEDSYAGFGTYSRLKNDPRPEDLQIKILAGNELPKNSPCSPSLTGATETTPLLHANGKAEWGRANWKELQKQEGYIPPFNTENIKCGGGTNDYAFCSQKDGKTVVICIKQQRDNPELAKQIFDSFKWTK